MHTKGWRAEQMGSEGWAVFMPNPKLPRFEIMIASNLSEEHAHLIAAALELLEALQLAKDTLETCTAHDPDMRDATILTVKEAISKAKSRADTLKGG